VAKPASPAVAAAPAAAPRPPPAAPVAAPRPPPAAAPSLGINLTDENAAAQAAYQNDFTPAQKEEADSLRATFSALHFNYVLSVYIACGCEKDKASAVLTMS
jgi:hypothetical protein